MTEKDESEEVEADAPEDVERPAIEHPKPGRPVRANASALRGRWCERCGNKDPERILGRFQRPAGQTGPCEKCGKSCDRGFMVAAGKTTAGAWEIPKADGARWNGSGPPKPAKARRVATVDDGKREREAAAKKTSLDVLSIRPLRPPGQSCASLPAPTLSPEREHTSEPTLERETHTRVIESPTPSETRAADPVEEIREQSATAAVVPASTSSRPRKPKSDPVDRHGPGIATKIQRLLADNGPSTADDLQQLASSRKSIIAVLSHLERSGYIAVHDGKWSIRDHEKVDRMIASSIEAPKAHEPTARARKPRQEPKEEMKTTTRPATTKELSVAQRLLGALLERRRMTLAECVACVSDRSISMVKMTLRDAIDTGIVDQTTKGDPVYTIVNEEAACLVVEGKTMIEAARVRRTSKVDRKKEEPKSVSPVRMRPREAVEGMRVESMMNDSVNSILSAAVARARTKRAVVNVLEGLPKPDQHIVLAELLVALGDS